MFAQTPFRVNETHGILLQPASKIGACSDDYGWTSLYASVQTEQPYEGIFPAVKDQLIVLHRDGPVAIDRLTGRPWRRMVPAGGMHLVPGGQEFGVRLLGELNTLHCYVRRTVLEEVAAEMIDGDPAQIEIPFCVEDADPSLLTLLEGVQLALQTGDTGTALYIDYVARAIAAQLIRHYCGRKIKQFGSTSRSGLTPIIADAIEFMRQNIDQSLSLNDIAGAINRSPSHFAREFRTDLGMPPHRYLIILRLEKAKHLIAHTNLSIAEIAFTCGFSHQEHLTRLFRRHCNTTPAAYRRSKRN